MQKSTLLAGVSICFWLAAEPAHASLLYASTSNSANNNTLRVVDQTTGLPTTIGPIGMNGARDMASDTRAESPRIWATSSDTGGDLYLVNPAGGSTLIGHMNTASNMRTLAFDITTGRLFGTTYARELYQIDPVTAAVTFVGSVTNFGGTDFDSLAFDAQGTLWMTTGGTPNSQLFTINTSTAVGTFKATTNHSTFFSDIAFRPEDGVLFGVDNSTGQLFTINTSTGVATPIAANPSANFDSTGLAFLPVPETTSLSALCATAVLVFSRRPPRR